MRSQLGFTPTELVRYLSVLVILFLIRCGGEFCSLEVSQWLLPRVVFLKELISVRDRLEAEEVLLDLSLGFLALSIR